MTSVIRRKIDRCLATREHKKKMFNFSKEKKFHFKIQLLILIENQIEFKKKVFNDIYNRNLFLLVMYLFLHLTNRILPRSSCHSLYFEDENLNINQKGTS
jgi:hypothetical protein